MKTIIAAIDFSNATHGVTEMASSLARAFQAKLLLFHVIDAEPSYAAYGFSPQEFPAMHALQEEARVRATQKMQHVAKSIEENSSAPVEWHLAEGSPLDCLLAQAELCSADLVVLGSHGHGVIASILLGSVAEGMVRRSKYPVLIVPAPPEI
ncbi:MAG: universal stress protein [Verrucomicrobia bacterium]|nr:MAG: universal stress protein [Verrucomicrobiota bacterium]